MSGASSKSGAGSSSAKFSSASSPNPDISGAVASIVERLPSANVISSAAPMLKLACMASSSNLGEMCVRE